MPGTKRQWSLGQGAPGTVEEPPPYGHSQAQPQAHGGSLQFPSVLPPYLDSTLISYEALKDSTNLYHGREIGEADVEMLEQQQGEETKRESLQRKGFFGGRITTKGGRGVYMLKITFLTLVPIIALIGVNISSLVSNITETIHAVELKKEIEFSLEVAKVIQYLGKERGIAAVVMSNLNRKSAEELKPLLKQQVIRYEETDRAINNMSGWPAGVSKELEFAGHEFRSRATLQHFLNVHRATKRNTTAIEEINFYSRIIVVFLDWLYHNIRDSKNEQSWPSLVAYEIFTSSLENMGMERSLGRVFYTNGHFDTDNDYLSYIKQYHVGKNNLALAGKFDGFVRKRYNKLAEQRKETFDHLAEMRLHLLNSRNRTRSPSIQLANWWYDNVTIMIDIMSQLHNDFARLILGRVQEELDNIFQALTVNIILFVSMIIFCPITVTFVHVLTRDLHNYALTLVEQTQALNTEKKKTDGLLFEMLPRAVAQSLKEGKRVEPAAYESASILFADIVDFTRLSSECSPMQVVDMLNNIYMCFDLRLQQYDVYKVETIGDGYMVVSGVPKPNGDRHAGEIATTALDLREHIQRVKVPHLPTKSLQIRVGINTGPVVAGVVGIKMPRYCLFGDAVNTAARMESHSLPNRIQISEATFHALEKLGGYITELRGEIEIKGRGDMITYWLKGKTFHVSSFNNPHSAPIEEETPLMFPQLKPQKNKNIKPRVNQEDRPLMFPQLMQSATDLYHNEGAPGQIPPQPHHPSHPVPPTQAHPGYFPPPAAVHQGGRSFEGVSVITKSGAVQGIRNAIASLT